MGSRRSARILAALAAIWLLLLLALGGWWASIVLHQADRLAQLEARLGLAGASAADSWMRTRHMLLWEGGTFLVLLLLISAVLLWLLWSDHARTRAMRAFFAAVTHELKTPLTSIRLQAEALAEGEGASTTLARRLLHDTNRLEVQVESSLELGRIEGGGTLSQQAIPLDIWLARATVLLKESYCDLLEFVLHVQGPCRVAADAAALQIILRNLVDNSLRHAGVQPVVIRLDLHGAHESVILQYQDNGHGYREGNAARLGQLFRRGKHSSGAGVGLYLIRQLMARMKGTVQFDSPPGGGFDVRLSFPAAAA